MRMDWGENVNGTTRRVGLGLAAAALLVFAAGGRAFAVEYIFTPLERTGWTDTKALSINNAGQVVGRCIDGSTYKHAVRWDDGLITDLRASSSWWYSAANGITASGRPCGNASHDGHGRLMTWDPVTNAPTEIGYIRTHTWGWGANDHGDIVGYSCQDYHGREYTDDARAIYYTSDNGIQLLAGLGGGFSRAEDINNNRVIVGRAEDSSGDRRACVWENLTPSDLGTLGGNESLASALNDSGLIVGHAQLDNGDQRPCIWENGIPRDLGTLGGDYGGAMGVNEVGQVVGYSKTSSGEVHAFLWEDNEMLDLNDVIPSGTGWVLSHARDINDYGQIVGYGTIGGQDHAWMLTVIPEPASVGMLVLGAGALALLRRRRK